ncbi:hypothetical protein ABFS82_08G179600 [Erythranthe guttata]
MGDFLYQWDFAFDLFLDERTPKKIKLYREYASNIASLYCPVLNKSILKESSVVPREKSRNIVRFLDDIQRQLIKRFKCLLTVEACHVAEVLSMRTDVPLTQILPSINNHKRKAIYMTKQRVVNQERVINEIYETLSVSGPITTRPRGSFLLLGGSGVGKTEIAKAVALHWYCDASRLVEIDMSEYAEPPQLESANCDIVEWSKRMHREFWNRLTEIVAKRPYSVILLDKVDKASSIVARVLVEVLSYGDSKRSIVDFSNSIIFMTSSVGSTQLPPLFSSTNWNEDVLEQLRRNPVEFYRARICNLRGSEERVLAEVRRIFDAELLNSVKILVVRRFQNNKAVARLLLREIVRDIYGERFVVHASNAAIDALFLKAPTVHIEAGKAFQKALLEHVIPQLATSKGADNASVYIDTLVGTHELSFRFQVHGQNAPDWYLKLADGTFDNLLVGLKKKVKTVHKIFNFRRECLRMLLTPHSLFLLGNLLANSCDGLLKCCLGDKPLTCVFKERASWDNILPTIEEKKKKTLKSLVEKLKKRNDSGIAKVTSVILDALVKTSDAASLESPNLPDKHFLIGGLNGGAKEGLISSLNESVGESLFVYIKLDDNCRGEEVKKLVIDEVKKRPSVVVLFDGIEFADDVIYKSILEILDKGTLDGDCEVEFWRSIVILLTDVENKPWIAEARFNCRPNVPSSMAVNQSVKRFRTELMHRVDGIIVFNPAAEDDDGPFLRIPGGSCCLNNLQLFRCASFYHPGFSL